MMISMIGKKDRIVKVLICWSTKIHPKISSKWNLIQLIKKSTFFQLWILKKMQSINLLKLLAKKSQHNLKKKIVLMFRIRRRKGRRLRLKWNRLKWWESIRVKIILRRKVRIWKLSRNGRKLGIRRAHRNWLWRLRTTLILICLLSCRNRYRLIMNFISSKNA